MTQADDIVKDRYASIHLQATLSAQWGALVWHCIGLYLSRGNKHLMAQD